MAEILPHRVTPAEAGAMNARIEDDGSGGAMDIVMQTRSTYFYAMFDIAWSEFSWDAFATLTVGVSAVAGAVWVGRRQLLIAKAQTEIAARQTQILAQQVRLDEITLRHDLFDRRLAVYDAVADYLGWIMKHATAPDREHGARFLKAMGKSRFLFRPEVHDHLNEIWKDALQFRALTIRMRSIYDSEGHYGEGNPELEERLLKSFANRIQNLPEIFGDDLRLSI